MAGAAGLAGCRTSTSRGGTHGRRDRQGRHQAHRRRGGHPAHPPEVVALISSGGLPKGDALATARVAGILAAKRTSDLIPLCHQLALTGVDIDFEIREAEVGITATVRSTDRTGVDKTVDSFIRSATYNPLKGFPRGGVW